MIREKRRQCRNESWPNTILCRSHWYKLAYDLYATNNGLSADWVLEGMEIETGGPVPKVFRDYVARLLPRRVYCFCGATLWPDGVMAQGKPDGTCSACGHMIVLPVYDYIRSCSTWYDRKGDPPVPPRF